MTPSVPAPVAELPGLLASAPIQFVGWFASAVLAALALRVVLGRLAGAGRSGLAAVLVANVVRITLFAVALLIGTSLVIALGERPGLVGSIARWSFTVLAAAAAYTAGLFIARQLLAPPWWRLNAWDEGGSAAHRFGVLDACRWIRDDIVELVGSLRLVERIVVLGCVPLAGINAMALFGAQRVLVATYAALLVLYVALVVALFTANRIPRILLTRLQDLRQVARRIAGGDLSARVGYRDTAEYEELGELVADVNSMAKALQSREQENAALTQQLNAALQFEQERASRDPLTQLRNHRYFQEALAAELYRCSRTGEVTTIAIIDLDDFKAVNDEHGHQEGDAVLVRTAAAFTSALRPYDLPARLGGEEFGVIFPSTSPEEAKVVMDRIMEALATAGPGGNVLTFSGGIATFPTHAADQSTLYQLADSSAYAAKLNGKKHSVIFNPGTMRNVAEGDRVNTRERDAQMKAAKMLVATVDTLEGFGSEHSETVGRISAAIARAMGFDEAFSRQVYLCGLLHDVGKLGLEQSLMQKAGQLTAEEFERVKQHPELSAQIVSNAGLGDIAAWVRHHHEHFDGTGYPHGLAGHDIPLPSRIVLAAEAFDVMTTDRAYRMAMSTSAATVELMRSAGTRFDPDVVAHLVQLVQQGEVGPGTDPTRLTGNRRAA